MRNLIADQVKDQWLWLTFANRGDLNVSALGTLQRLGDEIGTHALRRLAVDGGDDIAGTNASAKRRSVFVGRDDEDLVLLLLNDHAHAVVMAALILAHLGVGLRVIEVRVGIEKAQ